MKGQAKLEGMTELLSTLTDLRQSHRTRVIKPAVNKALTPVRKAVRKNMPVNSGLSLSAIVQKVWASKSKGTVGGLVGADKSVGVVVTHQRGYAPPKAARTPSEAKRLAARAAIPPVQVLERPEKILHLIEFGRAAITVTKKKVLSAGKSFIYGTHVAAAPAYHPLAKAWAATKSAAQSIVAAEIPANLAKLLARVKR
jgi:hypothetical protein